MPLRHSCIETSHGRIAVLESGGAHLPLVLLHGNSMCKEVFLPQLESSLGDVYRLIAMDLPGHGASANARDPQKTYLLSGHADAVIETLHAMGIERAAFYGWSLGGHIVMEIMHRSSLVAGAMFTGAPPVRPGYAGFLEGFIPHPAFEILNKDGLTDDEIATLAHTLAGPDAPVCVAPAIARADARARLILFQSIADNANEDERAIVEGARIPLAFVDGEHEPLAKLSYIDEIAATASLWPGGAVRLPGVGHAPALESPATFNMLLLRFMRDVSKSLQAAGRERTCAKRHPGRRAAISA